MNQKIKALVVEDKSFSRNDLKRKLKNLSSNTWEVNTAANVEEGISIIKSSDPNIVFLDIVLDDRNCFDLLDEVRDDGGINFEFVFTTEFIDDHYKKALHFSSFEFLEKPVDENHLRAIMNNFSQQLQDQELKYQNLKDSIQKNVPKLVVKQERRILIFNIPDIICFEADSNTTRIHHIDDEISSPAFSSKPLKFYDELLSDSEKYQFFRCHQSFFVNKDYILKYHERGEIELRKGIEIKKKMKNLGAGLFLFLNLEEKFSKNG